MSPWIRSVSAAVALALASAACNSGSESGAADRPRTELRETPADGVSPPGPSASALEGTADKQPQAPDSGAALIDTRPKVVVLGDSLTAGLGLAQRDAYPVLLQQRADEEGLKYQVMNAGVSGDTSAGGVSRLEWALDGDVRVLIVALGGNDGLRGLPPDELKRNLTTIIERAQARKIQVILAGMEAPPNFGEAYTVSFRQVYSDLAGRYHTAFIPFLLDRVAGVERLNQGDGIHPTAEGARLVADNVWTVLRPMLLKGS